MGRKRKPRPELAAVEEQSASLERQADAILSAANDAVMAELAKHTTLLEAMQLQLTQPRNDPEYLKTLEANEANRNAISNKVSSVHIVPDNGRTWLSIGLTEPRNHAEAIETARKLGQHLEAEVINHDGSGT